MYVIATTKKPDNPVFLYVRQYGECVSLHIKSGRYDEMVALFHSIDCSITLYKLSNNISIPKDKDGYIIINPKKEEKAENEEKKIARGFADEYVPSSVSMQES